MADRQLVAIASNRLWGTDLTYVKTHSEWVYVAFIIDEFNLRQTRRAGSTLLLALGPRHQSSRLTQSSCMAMLLDMGVTPGQRTCRHDLEADSTKVT